MAVSFRESRLSYTNTMLRPDAPALILAPMEGVTDAPMRAVMGAWGAFSFSVSEFLRVSSHVPPRGIFLRHVPELRSGAVTPTGLPVQVQILGGDAGRMAAAAVVAVECGATAIDINFGCPAPTVNRHDGGATLLKHPKRIREIVGEVRAALPASIPVSAKLRLGWDCIDAVHENAAMAAEGGAAWVTIHGRTRLAGYCPPIFWEPIGKLRRELLIPVVANGDIWTLDDFRRCRDVTGCVHFMLGRGALADPRLPRRVAAELGLGVVPEDESIDWRSQLESLVTWTGRYREVRPERVVRRLKQWLKMAANRGTFARFDAIKRAETFEELFAGVGSTCSVGV